MSASKTGSCALCFDSGDMVADTYIAGQCNVGSLEYSINPLQA